MPIPADYVALRGSDRKPLPEARITAPADLNEQIQVTVMVRPKKPLASAAGQLNYGGQGNQPRHMTPEEYRAEFGADTADLARVADFAKANGLTVTESNEASRSVKLTGSTGAFAKAFGVELHRYEHPGGSYRGRTGAVNIPASLEGVVEGVFGLDDRPAAEPRCGILTDAATAASGGAKALAQVQALAGGTFNARQLTQLYGFPPVANGAGQTIGIIELAGGINNADLAPYFQGLGVPQPPIAVVLVDGAQNTPAPNDNNATLEVMLDIEVAGAVAPAANIAVYFTRNTDQSFINAVNAAVHDPQRTLSALSISWGKSEDSWTGTSRQAMDQAFHAAALLGITVCCASGDNGSSDAQNDGRSHVDFPASSPNAIACGGTSLTANGTTIASEVVWNNAPGQATGGGISDAFGVPGYQTQVTLPASANPGAGAGRGVPDVSGHAASYAMRFFGNNISAFGTSAVAPLWAGLTALINQTTNTRFGLMTLALYAHQQALRDVTSGNNGAYSASSGWDPCTGLGSPNGSAMVAVLKPSPTRRGNRNFIQSNWGNKGNFELLVPHGAVINEYFRNNDDPALPWHFLRSFGYPAPPAQLGPTPRAVTFLQSDFRADGAHGNFDTVVRVAPAIASQGDHLDFWFLDSKTVKWNGPFGIVADGQPIGGVTGDPVMIQSNWGRHGNYELLVPSGNMIRHYFRNNDDPAFGWHFLRQFGYPTAPNQQGPTPRSVTFIQSDFRGNGVNGNFEAVVRVSRPLSFDGDHLDFWWLDSSTSKWNGPFPIMENGQPVGGVTGDPVLVQGNFGSNGNFELLVPTGRVIRHFFRNNDDPAFPWSFLREFGYPSASNQVSPRPRSVAFFQSNFNGDGIHGNFEAVVRVAPAIATQPDHLDFWFFDSRPGKWNGPSGLMADGQPVTGVTGD